MRPKDWENPHMPIGMAAGYPQAFEANIYEAGADAMLKALFKMAKESPTGTFVIDSHVINIFTR